MRLRSEARPLSGAGGEAPEVGGVTHPLENPAVGRIPAPLWVGCALEVTEPLTEISIHSNIRGVR